MINKLTELDMLRMLVDLVSEVAIIESVDSICRDSADMQYMLIQTNFSKSPKQLTYKPF